MGKSTSLQQRHAGIPPNMHLKFTRTISTVVVTVEITVIYSDYITVRYSDYSLATVYAGVELRYLHSGP